MHGFSRPFAARACSALLGFLVFFAGTATAAPASQKQFKPAPEGGERSGSHVMPRALDTTPVTVVVVLGGESVADVQLRTGRKLTAAEKNAVQSQRRAEQAAPQASIQAAGGRVVGSFQSAMNGLKVRIPQNRIAELRKIPGVVDVKRVEYFTRENFLGAQRVQAPFAWSGALGVDGENVKIAIIDTGIDYTHANFGGPGTPADFALAASTSAAPADPALFGPGAPKVKGGTDLAGDAYDGGNTPMPDPNPLDCAANLGGGHGSHVAGSAAGFGVLSNGTTYGGPYDHTTHDNAFAIGPGVAPRAELYAVRVFGCTGGTDLVPEALEWAIENDMDVVNMSLGSAFGTSEGASAEATDNAVEAGISVVTSAGNNGLIDYVTGSPGSASRAIATASTPAVATVRTANFDTSPVVNGINANGANWTSPLTAPLHVLRNPDMSVSLGCDPQEYVDEGVAGKIVVVLRGVCARVARAIYGQQAGAVAVVMINTANALPPFEGPITANPDTGEAFTVTIPFLGIRGTTSSTDDNTLVARDGTSVMITEGAQIPTGTSGFSSLGPRTADSFLKPDVSAPGEAIVSTGVGTGSGPATISGTSMASPHVAGVAALVRQAHPTWSPAAVKAAIINSGDGDTIAGYLPRRNGSGMVDASTAAATSAYAYSNLQRTSASFGLVEFATQTTRTRTIHVKNTSHSPATFDVTAAPTGAPAGSPHTAVLSDTQITVPGRGARSVDLTLTVPAATAGNSDAFRDVSGVVTFTPTSVGSNGGIELNVPYLLVPRVSANVAATLPKLKGSPPTATAKLTNVGSAIGAQADFYAWGLESGNDGLGHADLRAAGVQAIDLGLGEPVLVFAVNTYRGWSSGFNVEFDIFVDTDGDGLDDYVIFNIDFGLWASGVRNGQHVAIIYNLETNAWRADFLVDSRTDGSTMLLPLLASSIGVNAGNPRLSYTVESFDLTSDAEDQFATGAEFNAFTPAISNGAFPFVPSGATVNVPISVDLAEFATTPALGVMIVAQDNKNGVPEAKLLKARF